MTTWLRELAGEESLSYRKTGGTFGITGLSIIVFLSVAFFFGVARPFIVEIFLIPSESMAPTLQVGDHVLVGKFPYRIGDPARGDIAVFRSPEDGKVAMKRIVGLPGDVIEIRDGVLFVNGKPRQEQYVDYRLTDASFFGPERVSPDHLFVMGDNRSNSLDSRSFGSVPREDFMGRAFASFRPPGDFRVF